MRTGRLRDSIIATPVVRFPDRTLVAVWARAPYALWVEIGTRRMAAQPYLRPTLQTVAAASALLIARAKVATP